MDKYDIQKHANLVNIAAVLDEATLTKLGNDIKTWVDQDWDSSSGWREQTAEWIKLASQVKENKNYPWPNASNVKYPLVTLAALQFHARALPSLIPDVSPVKCRIVGQRLNPAAAKRAARVSTTMSYQVMTQMTEWVDTNDRMLFLLPMTGVLYKKTYYDSDLGRNKSVLLLPDEFIINYHGTLDDSRKTHRFYKDPNKVIELQRAGIYRDTPALLTRPQKEMTETRDESHALTNVSSPEEQPWEIRESHCWYDLDEDGYKEPYIVTYHQDSGTVLRVVARWSPEGVFFNEENEVLRIVPDSYFTQFLFIPDPSSDTYGIGFGHLLGPTNEAVNSLINQLIDAGTLSNLQSGFLARGVKLPGGAARIAPGEWKIVNTTGDDLRKGVFPLPVREPSGVLLSLLQLLISSGERVGSVTDMMVGESPGQNQPATTSMAVLEQGMKVFNGIYTRIHRALSQEYQKLYILNYHYLDDSKYAEILLENVGVTDEDSLTDEQRAAIASTPMPSVREDFSLDSITITPTSDPNYLSDQQKRVKADSLMAKMAAGMPLNSGLVFRKVLEAEGHDDIEELLEVPPPQPDPMVLEELEDRRHARSVEDRKLEIEKALAVPAAMLDIAKAEEIKNNMKLDRYDRVISVSKTMLEHLGSKKADETDPRTGTRAGTES